MKEVIESYRTAALELVEVSASAVKPETVAVGTVPSLISVTTESYMPVLAKKNLLQKAKARSDPASQLIARPCQ